MDYNAQMGATGALSGAGTGALIGSAVPGIGTVIGAIGGGILGAMGGFLGGGGSKGPDVTAMAANQQGRQEGQVTAASGYAYLQTEPYLAQLYAYMGFTPAQIKTTLTNQRAQLADKVAGAASDINNYAYGSGGQTALYVLLSDLGAEKYGYPSSKATPLPDLSNLPSITAKWNKTFAFDKNATLTSPTFQFAEEQRRKYQNASDASKGLLNSGYSAVANAQGIAAEVAAQTPQEYGYQLSQYNTEFAANQAGQAYDLNKQNELMTMLGLNNQAGATAQSGVNAQLGAASTLGSAAMGSSASMANTGNLIGYNQGVNLLSTVNNMASLPQIMRTLQGNMPGTTSTWSPNSWMEASSGYGGSNMGGAMIP